jgi:hypothetical protein
MQLSLLIVAIALIGPMILGENAVYADPSQPVLTAVAMESRDIRATLVDAPVVSGNFGDPPRNQFGTKQWVQIAFDFKSEDAVKGYIEELKFKVYVEGVEYQSPTDTVGVPVLLTGEVTYLDVPAKSPEPSKNTGYFFIHPSAIDRFGTRNGLPFSFVGANKNKSNKNIRIEALLGGQPVVLNRDTGAKYVDLLRDDEKWVDQCKPVANQIFSQDHTPWAGAWADTSLMIKPAAAAAEGN